MIGAAGYGAGQLIPALAGRKTDSGWRMARNAGIACGVGFVTEGIGAWIGALTGAAEELGPAAELAAEEADEVETFYRTMSEADYAALQETGQLSATSETFITPSADYAAQYEGVTVEFQVQGGTTAALAEVGVRDSSNLVSSAYPDMPSLSSGWTSDSAFLDSIHSLAPAPIELAHRHGNQDLRAAKSCCHN